MGSVDESLVSYLLGRSGITSLVDARVSQATVPEGESLPYIWINRGASETLDDLSANPSDTTAFYESFDVECVSGDLAKAQLLAAEVKSLHKNRGEFGAGAVQALIVSDHSDHYRPKNIGDDDGRHVASVEIEIIGYTE